MLLKIAWRNIWRNKVRSLVVIIAIALGLWAGVFASAFVNGLMQQRVESVIQLEMSHVQIHHPTFRDEFEGKYIIHNSNEVVKQLTSEPETKAVSARLIAFGAMLATANSSGSVKVVGIDPSKEAAVTEIDSFLIDGAYFSGIKRNPIYISDDIAEKYKLKVRSKLVLTVQDTVGEIMSSSFRVVGIFNTNNGLYDKMNVFVREGDLRKLMHLEDNYHEIAALFSDHSLAEPKAKKLADKFNNLEVLPWMDLSTGMRMMIEMMDYYTLILVGIILLALLFSIVNTMLMAVLDRTRELGVLMAVGMNRIKIFFMIMIETVFIALIGGPLGLVLAWSSIQHFAATGIDLGSSTSYEEYGFSTIVYPYLELEIYVQVTFMVIAMAIIAAIYPAIKALRLKPVEAIRKI